MRRPLLLMEPVSPQTSVRGRYVRKMAKISSRCVGRYYPTSCDVGWTISLCAT
ncbi:hypothetical protein NG798_23185 [Ancylothrix sp. C2]|nr:hypothetical protein [Ancylothrix sp. D3o]